MIWKWLSQVHGLLDAFTCGHREQKRAQEALANDELRAGAGSGSSNGDEVATSGTAVVS